MIENRYPDADVLAQRGHWDKATRDVVLDRVHNVPGLTHFSGERRRTLEALCERVVPQQQRPDDRRVPIAPWIDAHCSSEQLDGFRFDNMPPNPEAWERGLDGLVQSARSLFARAFAELGGESQDEVLRRVRDGDPPGEVWRTLPAKRWWRYVALRQILGVYYAHPFAWDQIGFGGPAYPRGYLALNHGAPEPWEPREKRGGKGRGR